FCSEPPTERGVAIYVANTVSLVSRNFLRAAARTHLAAVERMTLQRAVWRKRKHGLVRHVKRVLHAGISVSRVQCSSMVSNTCCTALLLQGAPAPASPSPP